MSKGRWKFRRTDLRHALEEARRTGYPVRSFRIDKDGGICIDIGEPVSANDLDRELAEFEERHAGRA